MAYVPGYKYDIFVSYSHNDNAAVPGRDLWVTTFLEALKGLLRASFGQGVDDLEIFLDDKSFESNKQLPDLLAAAKASAVFLAVCSPNYEARPWTRAELHAFHENSHDTERLFAAETYPLDAGILYPEPLQSHHRIEFWVRPPMHSAAHPEPLALKSPDWILKVSGLAGDIKKKLKSMHALAVANNGAVVANGVKAPAVRNIDPGYRRILLAQTNEGLLRQRGELRTYLEQFGVAVLPAGVYPQGGADFAAAFGADLETCDIFVQLLGESPGLKPPDLPQGYPRYQFDAARERNIQIIQWRDPGLVTTTIDDEDHQALVTGPYVVAEGFEAFKADVLKAAKPPPPPPKPVFDQDFMADGLIGQEGDTSIVFVGAENGDRAIARKIAETFSIHNLFSILSGRLRASSRISDENLARKLRAELEQGVLDCDGLVVIYGPTGRGTGQRVIAQYLRVKHLRRGGPARALAIIYVDPTDDEEEDSFVGLGQEILHIHAPEAVSADVLRPVIEALRGAEPVAP